MDIGRSGCSRCCPREKNERRAGSRSTKARPCARSGNLTGCAPHLFVHPKRGEKALCSESSILPGFSGWAIHDHMAAYYKFTQAKHGACNAHILRELQGLVENGSVWAGEMRAFLLERYGKVLPLPGEAATQAR